MKVKGYTAAGAARSGDVALPESVFDGTVNEDALHQVVTALRAHRRQGTHATKTRQTIRGGGRKPWRQKGTGRARAGSIRSPLWRGGAVTFGPQPRDYDKQIPRKLKRLATNSALNARALDGDLVVVEELAFEAPKTSRLAELFAALGAEGNVLLLTDGVKREVYLSGRNIPDVKVMPWGEASAYDVLWAQTVVIEEPALAGDEEDA